MNNFKITELPVGTTVKSAIHGHYEKDDLGIWAASSFCCVDCREAIVEIPTPENIASAARRYEDVRIDIGAEEFLGEFEVVSIPWKFAVHLATTISEEEAKRWDHGDGTSPDNILKEELVEYMKEIGNVI